jgi:hypothetical protein
VSAVTSWTPILRLECGADCAWCEQEIPAGELAMMSTDGSDFFCAGCVTMAYEAMEAAQG